MHNSSDRRRHQRFTLPTAYARILVRLLDSDEFEWEGHAYDLSEGGVRFELDRAIEPGTPIAMRIELPHTAVERSTERRSLYAFANVVWMEDDDQPGPVRLAAVFTRFARADDAAALRHRLFSGRYAMAA